MMQWWQRNFSFAHASEKLGPSSKQISHPPTVQKHYGPGSKQISHPPTVQKHSENLATNPNSSTTSTKPNHIITTKNHVTLSRHGFQSTIIFSISIQNIQSYLQVLLLSDLHGTLDSQLVRKHDILVHQFL